MPQLNELAGPVELEGSFVFHITIMERLRPPDGRRIA